MEDYWPASKKMLGELNFLQSLKEYDKDNIPEVYVKKIRQKYINNPDFDPDKIKNVSSACEGLCKWVIAIEVYDGVSLHYHQFITQFNLFQYKSLIFRQNFQTLLLFFFSYYTACSIIVFVLKR